MRTAYEQNVITRKLPLYGLSKLVPVPMKSCYGVSKLTGSSGTYEPQCATWWQWRGRVWNHKIDGQVAP